MAKVSANYEVVYIIDPAQGEEAIAATPGVPAEVAHAVWQALRAAEELAEKPVEGE